MAMGAPLLLLPPLLLPLLTFALSQIVLPFIAGDAVAPACNSSNVAGHPLHTARGSTLSIGTNVVAPSLSVSFEAVAVTGAEANGTVAVADQSCARQCQLTLSQP